MNNEAAILCLLLPPAALALDLVLGDPHTWPHPVRGIGSLLSWMERGLSDKLLNASGAFFPRMAGLGVMLGLVSLVWTFFLLAYRLDWLGVLIVLYMSYSGLALGCLLREFDKAASTIEHGAPEEGRTAVAMLVSRDTASMDRNDLRRSLAETFSENLNDGFVAPFFYLALFGPAALWMYKVVSTMDSMWGYRTQRYCHLGAPAARTDDVLAFLPARLTAAAIILCGSPARQFTQLWKRVAQDAAAMESPNAGWPMSAAAWTAHASMGGPTVYHGQLKHKPLLGPENAPWTNDSLHRLRSVCLRASLLCAAFLFAASLLFY